MDVVRITELQPKTYVEQGDYIAIDNQSDGTKKVQFTNLLDDTLSQENKIAPANIVGNEIATVKDEMEGEIATIRAAVGSPLKASTVAQMTDKNKIYVYVGSESGYTNGNWYYWNGSAWTSGGVYNSVAVVTDPTLTLSGVPADAKATGDEIGDLKSDISDITSVHYGKNRFNYADSTDGYSLNSNGQLVASASWATSDFCYVEGASSIYLSSLNIDTGYRVDKTLFYLCTYDASKTFIEQVGSMPSNPVSIGNNVAYVRFCYKIGTTVTPIADQDAMLEKGSSITAYEPFNDYRYVITDKTLTQEDMPADAYSVGYSLKHIQDVLGYTQATLTMTGEKLLNAHTGVISDSSGHTGWMVSDYVEVPANSKILVKTQHFWGQGLYAFYDENRTYISGFASANVNERTRLYNEMVETPSDAKYIVIGFLYEDNFTNPALFIGVKQDALPSERWADLKWACIGDSLTASYGATDIHYFEYIRALTGIETINLGASGCGYAYGEANFMTKGLLVPNDADVVTIFGSGNDGSSSKQLGTASDSGTDTIAGCINTTIDNIYSVLPVVNLGIITPTPWVNNMPSDNGFMENYSNLIVEICKRRSIPCLDLFHESNLNPNSASARAIAYSKDNGGGVHPNEIGHKMIASQVKEFIQKLILK